MRVVLHPEAHAEFRAAALWYDEQRTGLGDDFVAEVTAILGRIGDTPKVFPLWPGPGPMPESIRRAVITRFPYVVAFQALPEHILVLTVAHVKRRPLYWLSRSR